MASARPARPTAARHARSCSPARVLASQAGFFPWPAVCVAVREQVHVDGVAGPCTGPAQDGTLPSSSAAVLQRGEGRADPSTAASRRSSALRVRDKCPNPWIDSAPAVPAHRTSGTGVLLNASMARSSNGAFDEAERLPGRGGLCTLRGEATCPGPSLPHHRDMKLNEAGSGKSIAAGADVEARHVAADQRAPNSRMEAARLPARASSRSSLR